jgi:hypothetical protein
MCCEAEKRFGGLGKTLGDAIKRRSRETLMKPKRSPSRGSARQRRRRFCCDANRRAIMQSRGWKELVHKESWKNEIRRDTLPMSRP